MRNRIMSLRMSITEFVGEMMASFLEVSSVEGRKVGLSPLPRNCSFKLLKLKRFSAPASVRGEVWQESSLILINSAINSAGCVLVGQGRP
jgi:hypothetical protein